MADKIKILIACHKPTDVYCDEIYTPIHVGKKLSTYNMNMIGDDTGENISEKNPMYCELTAEYWAWKNLKNVEYIGLCHYRRFFETQITLDNVDNLLGKKHDVLLASPFIERRCVGVKFAFFACMEDLQILMTVIKEKSPEYYSSTLKLLKGNVYYPYNMFIMKKELFDEFAEWQFKILGEVEKKIRLSNYSRRKRVLGYMAEMILLPSFVLHKKLRTKTNNIISSYSIKFNTYIKLKTTFVNIYNKLIFPFIKDKVPLDKEAVIIGLKNDGIL